MSLVPPKVVHLLANSRSGVKQSIKKFLIECKEVQFALFVLRQLQKYVIYK